VDSSKGEDQSRFVVAEGSGREVIDFVFCRTLICPIGQGIREGLTTRARSKSILQIIL